MHKGDLQSSLSLSNIGRLNKMIRKLITTISMLTLSSTIFASTLLVGNKNDASLSFVDLESRQITKVIKTGIGPHEIAISSNQQLAAVVNYGDRNNRGDSVAIIDLNKGEIVRTIQSNSLLSPHGVQWMKDNTHLWITAERNKSIVKINALTGKIVSEAKTRANGSHMLVISPDENTIAVTNLGSASTTFIDAKTNDIIIDLKTGGGAEGVDYSADGKRIWVTNRDDDTVSVIEQKSFKIIKQLKSEGFPIRVKVSKNGKYALVSNANKNTLTVFDAKELKHLKTIEMSSKENDKLQFPVGILIDTNDKFAYVAHAGGDKVSIIDLDKLARIKIIDAGPGPDGMGYVDRKLTF